MEQLKGGVWVKASEILPDKTIFAKVKGWFNPDEIKSCLLTPVAETEYYSVLAVDARYSVKKESIIEWLDGSLFDELIQQNQQLQEDYNIQEYKLSQCVKDNISLNGKITELQAEKEKLMADNKLYGDIAVVILQAEKEKLMSDYISEQVLCQNNKFKK